MTERLIVWTTGAAGTLQSFTCSVCDWVVATMYRCLLLVPEAIKLRYTREGVIIYQ